MSGQGQPARGGCVPTASWTACNEKQGVTVSRDGDAFAFAHARDATGGWHTEAVKVAKPERLRSNQTGGFMRRLSIAIATMTAVAVPVSVLVGTASPASASTVIACKKMAGSLSGTVSISKCSGVPSKKTYKKLVAETSAIETGGNLYWNTIGGTDYITVGNIETSSPGQGLCPRNWTEEDTTFQVTGASDPFDQTMVGDTATSDTCLNKSATKFKLVKGTEADF